MPWEDVSALRALRREMEEELQSLIYAAAQGVPADWAAYRHLVGRIEATRQWLARLEEIRSADSRQADGT